MPALSFSCPACQTTLRVDDKLQGKQVRCPKCQKPVTIPAAGAASAAPNQAVGWFISRNQKEFGPYSAADLAKLARAGKVKPTDLVKRGTDPDWRPASSVKGLFAGPGQPTSTPAGLQIDEAPRPKAERRRTSPLLLGAVAGGILLVLAGSGIGGYILFFRGDGDSPATNQVAANTGAGPETPAPTRTNTTQPAATPPAETRPPTGTPETTPVSTAPPADPVPALDLDLIPSTFTAALVVHPQRLLQSELVAPLLKEEWLQKATDDGLDPRKLEQVVIYLDPFPGGNIPFWPGFVLRLSEPVDLETPFRKQEPEATEAMFQGRKYYQLKEKFPQATLCVLFHDEQTVLIAPEPTLHRMLTPDKGPSPFKERLPQVNLNHDMVFFLALDQVDVRRNMPTVRQALTQALRQNQQAIPAEFAALSTVPDRLETATLVFDLNGDSLLKLDLQANNDASAGVVHGLVASAHDFVKLLYPTVRKQMEGAAPPDLARSLFPVLDDVVAGIAVRQDETRIVLDVKKPQGLASLPDRLAPFIEEMVKNAATTSTTSSTAPMAKDVRPLAVEWIRANNKFGPEDKFANNLADQIGRQVEDDQGFLLHLGWGLVKSGQATVLAGWAGEMFLFTMTQEQARQMNLFEFTTSLTSIRPGNDIGRPETEARLSDLKIDQADTVDPTQDLKGSVACERVGEGKGPLAVRLMYIGAGLQVESFHHLGNLLPAGQNRLSFTFPALSNQTPNIKGPVVVFVEVVSFLDPNRQGQVQVLSNPVAALIHVGKPE